MLKETSKANRRMKNMTRRNDRFSSPVEICLASRPPLPLWRVLHPHPRAAWKVSSIGQLHSKRRKTRNGTKTDTIRLRLHHHLEIPYSTHSFQSILREIETKNVNTKRKEKTGLRPVPAPMEDVRSSTYSAERAR